MEKTNHKKNRIGEIGIIVLVLVCAMLVLAEMTTNLVKEVDTLDTKPVITQVGTPTWGPSPTLHPDYTPDAHIDS
jgi:hypothetical protein